MKTRGMGFFVDLGGLAGVYGIFTKFCVPKAQVQASTCSEREA